MHIKTENHKHKKTRTQIIHTQIGVKEVPYFGQFNLDNHGNPIPRTWKKPIIQKRVIHHNTYLEEIKKNNKQK